jgi:O-antigen/teichoic acid export membrane protein
LCGRCQGYHRPVSPDAKPQPAATGPRAPVAARTDRGGGADGGDGDGRPRSLVSRLLELSRHSLIYGLGGLVSRFLAVFMLPLYTSYVSAADYGRIELLMSAMAVAVVLIRGGANFGFIRFYFLEKEAEYRLRLIRTVFWAQMGFSTLALALCAVFASPLARALGVAWHPGAHLQGSGTSLVIATGVLLWVNVNYAQMTNLFRAEQRSVAFSIATLANIAITVPLTVILVVVYREGPLGIIVGNLSGTLVLFVALLAYRREQLGLQFDRQLRRSLNRFGVPLMAAALAMWVTNFGDRFMIRHLLHGQYAIVQVGQYSLANKISQAMVLLFTAFQIAWPAFAYSIEDEEEAKRAYSFVLTYLMFIAAWAALALSLFAPWIVHFLGRKPGYWPASSAVPALAYSSVFYAGFIVVTIAIGRARRTQFNWIAATAAAVVNFGLNVWLVPAYGMLGAAYATLAAYILLLIVRTWNAQRVFVVHYQWRRVAIILLAAGGLTGAGEALPRSLPLAFALALVYPLALAPLGFYLPAERRRLRRLLPAHN